MTEAGRVNRLSVAVLVDGSYSKNDKGDVAYAARTKEELDRIATLVRSAIGFDQKRGDQVEIVNLRFADTPSAIPVTEAKGLMGMFQFTKDDIMYFIELGVMSLLGLIVLFMVVRPLLKRILAAEPEPKVAANTLPAPVQEAQAALRPAATLDLAKLEREFTLRTREGFVENFGAALLARVAAEAPGVRLRFVPKPDRDSTPLRDGRVDLETGVIGATTGPELRAQSLFRDRFVAVVREGHALAGGRLTAKRYAAARHVARFDDGGGDARRLQADRQRQSAEPGTDDDCAIGLAHCFSRIARTAR